MSIKITKNMQPFWKTPSSNLPILENEIHIWRAALDLPMPSIQKLFNTLSIDEVARAERFRFDRDRRRFIVGRGILRKILGRYLSVEPSQVQFRYEKNGKPRLANTFGNQIIIFNMSDSEGLALLGFSQDRELGVDVELIRNLPDMDQIAERFFSTREYRLFHELPESKKKEAFFKCWTRKEAFIKAVGDGLSRSLDTFDVSVTPGQPARLLRIEDDLDGASRWVIQDLKPAPEFAASLAVGGRNWRLHCWQWPHEFIN